jgi:hypothetical protein
MDSNPVKTKVAAIDPSVPSPEHDKLVQLYVTATSARVLE